MELTLEDLREGFRQAYSRLKDAKNETEKLQVYFALFESLNWIVCIDDRLKKEKGEWIKQFGSDGDIVKALRFSRNRVHHQWADAIHLRKGATLPAQFPLSFHEWIWKQSKELPAENPKFANPMGQLLYEKLLQNQPVRYSLVQVNNMFDIIIP